MDSKNCLSCGMSLSQQMAHPETDKYCQYCADEEGKLKSREECKAGIAWWLQSITPEDKDADYSQRAEYYLKAMPAWAGQGDG